MISLQVLRWMLATSTRRLTSKAQAGRAGKGLTFSAARSRRWLFAPPARVKSRREDDQMERAARIHEYGLPEALTIEPIETPTPGPGQAPIRHTAIGLNF